MILGGRRSKRNTVDIGVHSCRFKMRLFESSVPGQRRGSADQTTCFDRSCVRSSSTLSAVQWTPPGKDVAVHIPSPDLTPGSRQKAQLVVIYSRPRSSIHRLFAMMLQCWEHVLALIMCTLGKTPRACKHAHDDDHLQSRGHASSEEFLQWASLPEAQCRNPDCKLRFCVFLHKDKGTAGGLADVLHQNLVYTRKERNPVHFDFVVGHESSFCLTIKLCPEVECGD